MDKRFVLLNMDIIILDKKDNIPADRRVLATVIKNISFFGYLFSEELISVLETYSNEELVEFYNKLVSQLKDLLGIRDYKPFYPNFPKQVMEADDVELYLNAVIHYLSNGQIMPSYSIEDRVKLLDRTDIKILKLGNDDTLKKKFLNLLAAKTSLSNEDCNYIKWYVSNNDVIDILPDSITLKENACLLVNEFSGNHKLRDEAAKRYIKTTTDVLRLATAMSHGDISLKCNSRFRSFTRNERRFLLSLFEERLNEEELLKYVNRYKRLARILHSSEYLDKYPKITSAFNKLRQGEKIRSFNGLLELKIEEGNLSEVIKLLKSRPGIFVRRLNSLLTSDFDKESILNALEECIDNVETTVIIQSKTFFEHRNDDKALRSFFPKGQTSKLFVMENNLAELNEDICSKVVDIFNKSLISRYSVKEPLGKVYIDRELKNYTVPFGQRSASKALVTLSRGSRVKMDDSKNTIRLFIYWREPEDSRSDIDLSCLICDKNFKEMYQIAYYNLREDFSYHSGDIVAAPNGASEFIDIDIAKILEETYNRARYVIVNINSFTKEKLKDIPECFAGWMLREHVNSGEIYEPTTIVNRFDVTCDSTSSIPVIFDLHKREAIWVDSSFSSKAHMPNNLYSNVKGIELVSRAICEKSYPNLYDLFMLHGKARGEIVQCKEEADTIFAVNEGIRPTDFDIIVGEYL